MFLLVIVVSTLSLGIIHQLVAVWATIMWQNRSKNQEKYKINLLIWSVNYTRALQSAIMKPLAFPELQLNTEWLLIWFIKS